MIDPLVSSYGNEFHRLDRALFQKSGPVGAKALLFTSAHPGEGVTTIVTAFSSFLTKLHGPGEIIVIEANLRQPHLAGSFGLSDSEGLIDALMNRVELDALIQKTSFGLSVITAGINDVKNQGISIEASLERMGEIITELRKSYRYILIDSPAIVPYIDSTITAGFTDGVVLVVEANATRSEVLEEAADRLKSSGAEILGTILNKREYHIPKWLYRIT